MISFADFVTNYWNKKRRSGALWTPQSVSEDTGLNQGDVQVYFSFCDEHRDLPDAQLISLNPILRQTPFGLQIVPAPVSSTGDPLDLTLDKVTLRQLLAAMGK